MKQRHLLRRVSERQTQLDVELAEALVKGSGPSVVEPLEKEAAALGAVLARATARGTRWRIPAAVAGAALIAVTIGLLVRLTPLVGLDAKLHSIHFTVAPGGAAFTSTEPVAVTELEIVGDLRGERYSQARSIQSLGLIPGTRASLVSDTTGCHSLTLAQEPGGRIDLELGALEGPQGGNVSLGPGVLVRFCAAEPVRTQFAGPVSELNVWRIHQAEATPILLPSISTGTLRISQTNREITLGGRDRLAFSDITSGWLIITPQRELKMLFSGMPDKAQWVGLSADDREDLSPTLALLEVITKHPRFAALVSAFTGLVGLIWGIGRYFGFS